ncbi:Dihydrofolate synthase/folylpolyglutamate synthase [Sinobacterium norvegicum]|uniref:Dihydrofolate synthase/folylpolyglutamate synthase n=1 Tax=Sinobacterium norvegicum TaxID=1641715 RepID=A0ABN8EDP0_9GAMM|nr:bifunctional tetrahydrofolate synthase/dihydrofolate synthase [Sinobacterium norvegicum]CAH0990361.1 Dihydrofolate synthase/folylpolyglutamate synthase [Sinobacterium norvegicum]
MVQSKIAVNDWLQRIEALHPADIELGLDRINEVAKRLQLLQPCSFVVTVAGTNGKGSTVATLEALLLASGQSVGCYTSPHILRFNERIKIGGIAIDDDTLVEAFEAIESARGEIDLTFFEFTTLAGLYCFADRGVDVILFEVGLGGRLDATNIIDADIAVVTNISIDHESWLGSDREVIGPEKAGICRIGRPVICADLDPPKSLSTSFAQIGAKPLWIGRDFGFDTDQLWTQSGCELIIDELPLSYEAAATAAQVIELSPFTMPPNASQVLSSIKLAGRYQRLQYQTLSVILDVAHNPASAERLARRLKSDDGIIGRCHVLLGAMADKDVAGLIEPLAKVVDGGWFVTNLKVDRAAKAEDLADVLYQNNIKMVSINKNLSQALARLSTLVGQDDTVVICGSFFTVSEALALFNRKEAKR